MARRTEIIDLVSDSEDDLELPAPDPAAVPADLRATPEEEVEGEEVRDLDGSALLNDDDLYENYFHMPGRFNDGPAIPALGDLADVPLVIDDLGYLDEGPQHQAGAEQEEMDVELAGTLDAEQVLSQNDCLSRIYEMFPDVCPEHTSMLYTQVGEGSGGDLSPDIRLDRIIDKLLTNGPYPRRKKETQLKRKREASVDLDSKRWEGNDREDIPGFLRGPIRAILKAEFPFFTMTSINEVLNEEKYLYKAYVHIAKLRDTDPTVRRGRAPVGNFNAVTIAENSGWPLMVDELTAARKRAQADRSLRLEEASKKRAEDDNLRSAVARGETAECQACFDDLPMNRQVHCDGETPHFTCFTCIETYIKTEIGDSRCRVLCTAGCGSGFEPAQLNLLLDKKLLEKLAALQQEKDIRDANLEDLEECPFCDYKAIMPPIEVNFEFQCANFDCEKVSCRRCKATSHIPISCEQYAKEKKANSRHEIEEAMTAALIRSCNKCKKQFIKEYGCNKMTCPSCGNLQCYICSETLKGYEHFSQHSGGEARPGGKCPLYDNLEARHEREVKAAEEAARAQVVTNNPEVAAEDLEIKMSDAVKKSTEDKIRRAGPEGLGGGPLGWGGVGLQEMFRDVLPQLNAGEHRAPLGGNNVDGARQDAQFAAQRQQQRLRQEERLQRLRLVRQQQARLRLDPNAAPAAGQAHHRRREAMPRRNIAPPIVNVDNNHNAPNAAPAQPPNLPFGFGVDPFGLVNNGHIQPWGGLAEPAAGAAGAAGFNPAPWNIPGAHQPLYFDRAGHPLIHGILQPAQNQNPHQQPQDLIHEQPFQRGPVPDGFLPHENDQAQVRLGLVAPQQGFGAANPHAYPAHFVNDADFQQNLNLPLNAAGRANVVRNLHHLEYLRQQNDARNANRIANRIATDMANQQHAGHKLARLRD